MHWSPGRGGRRLAAYSGRGPAKHGLCWRDERRGIGLARGCAPDTQMPAERSATLEPWICVVFWSGGKIIYITTRLKIKRWAGLFRAYAYPALCPEGTRSTRISIRVQSFVFWSGGRRPHFVLVSQVKPPSISSAVMLDLHGRGRATAFADRTKRLGLAGVLILCACCVLAFQTAAAAPHRGGLAGSIPARADAGVAAGGPFTAEGTGRRPAAGVARTTAAPSRLAGAPRATLRSILAMLKRRQERGQRFATARLPLPRLLLGPHKECRRVRAHAQCFCN